MKSCLKLGGGSANSVRPWTGTKTVIPEGLIQPSGFFFTSQEKHLPIPLTAETVWTPVETTQNRFSLCKQLADWNQDPRGVRTFKTFQCVIQSHILPSHTARYRSYGLIQYPGSISCSQNDCTSILQLSHWGFQHVLNIHQFQGTSVDSSPLALPTQTAQEYHKQHCSYFWITLKLGSSSLEMFTVFSFKPAVTMAICCLSGKIETMDMYK